MHSLSGSLSSQKVRVAEIVKDYQLKRETIYSSSREEDEIDRERQEGKIFWNVDTAYTLHRTRRPPNSAQKKELP